MHTLPHSPWSWEPTNEDWVLIRAIQVWGNPRCFSLLGFFVIKVICIRDCQHSCKEKSWDLEKDTNLHSSILTILFLIKENVLIESNTYRQSYHYLSDYMYCSSSCSAILIYFSLPKPNLERSTGKDISENMLQLFTYITCNTLLPL